MRRETLEDINALASSKFKAYTEVIMRDMCHYNENGIAPKGSVYPAGDADLMNLIHNSKLITNDVMSSARTYYLDNTVVTMESAISLPVVQGYEMVSVESLPGSDYNTLRIVFKVDEPSQTKTMSVKIFCKMEVPKVTGGPYAIQAHISAKGDISGSVYNPISCNLYLSESSIPDAVANVRVALMNYDSSPITDNQSVLNPDGSRDVKFARNVTKQGRIAKSILLWSTFASNPGDEYVTIEINRPMVQEGVVFNEYMPSRSEANASGAGGNPKGVLFEDVDFYLYDDLPASLMVKGKVLEDRIEIKPTQSEKAALKEIDFR